MGGSRRWALVWALLALGALRGAAFPAERVVPVVESVADYELRGPVLRVEYPPETYWSEDRQRYSPHGEPEYKVYEFDRLGRRTRRALGLWAPEHTERPYELSSDYRYVLSAEGLIQHLTVEMKTITEFPYTVTFGERELENRQAPRVRRPRSVGDVFDYREVLRTEADTVVEVQIVARGDQEPWRISTYSPEGRLVQRVDSPGRDYQRTYEYEAGRLLRYQERSRTERYEYNGRSFVARKVVVFGDATRRVYEYEYDLDQRGNWVERCEVERLADGSRVRVSRQRRVIVYY